MSDYDLSTLSNSIGTCGDALTIDDMRTTYERLRLFEERRRTAMDETESFIRSAFAFPDRDPAMALADLAADMASAMGLAYEDDCVARFWPRMDLALRAKKRARRKVRMARKRRRGWA